MDTVALAGFAQGFGGVSIDQLLAPEQSGFLLVVFVSIAQLQVAPRSVQALVKRNALTALADAFPPSELLEIVSSSRAARMKSCGPTAPSMAAGSNLTSERLTSRSIPPPKFWFGLLDN